MANTRLTQFFYTKHMMPALISGKFAVGGTGAVGTLSTAPGVTSVTRLAAGIYKILLQDNWNAVYSVVGSALAPVTGSDVAAGSLTPGVVYVITALGTTTTAQWVTAGVPVGIAPAVGVAFLAAATSAGTGTAKAIGASGVNTIEAVGLPSTTIAPSGIGSPGGYVIIKCIGPTDASTTTPIAVDPASGSTIAFQIYLSNSTARG